MAASPGRGAVPTPAPDWDTELALSLVNETKPSYDLKTRGKVPLSEDHLLALVDASLLPRERSTPAPPPPPASYTPYSSQLRVETRTTTQAAPPSYSANGPSSASPRIQAAFEKFDTDTLLGDLKDNHQTARIQRSPSFGNAMEREPYYSPGNCTKGELMNLINNPPSPRARSTSRQRSVPPQPSPRAVSAGASLHSPGGRPLNTGGDSLHLTMLDTSANRPTGYICGACNESINQRQPGCTALNQMFHITCFRCVACDQKLAGASFYAVDGKPYCEKDYVNTLDHCSICEKPITERILRASGKAYHPACFTCSVCSKCLDSVPFTVDNNNRIHCVPCFHDKYAPRCAICTQPIIPKEGEEGSLRVVALERSYHVECYKCEDCGMRLSSKIPGQECYPLDDHLYCKNCNLTHLRNLAA